MRTHLVPGANLSAVLPVTRSAWHAPHARYSGAHGAPRGRAAPSRARAPRAEFHKMFEALAAPGAAADGRKAQAFHVVAPSLPGYGFSSAPRQPGFGIRKIAATFDALMSALGYQTYVAQGAPRCVRGPRSRRGA